VGTFTVSLVASLIKRYSSIGPELCLYAHMWGGVVWLLPGTTKTVGIVEIFSKMMVYGTCRLIYGISMALQLGFGLIFAYQLVYGANFVTTSFISGCPVSVDPNWYFLTLPMMAITTAVLIQAQKFQIPGK
jgi:hypothetical protein